jgi:cell division septation protein DedD
LNNAQSGSRLANGATGRAAAGAQRNADRAQPSGQDATPAQLAAALRQASEANSQPFATSVRSASAAARCLTVGPFKDVSRSGRAVSLLRASGFTPKQRTENGDSWAGYWVYVGGLKSEAEQADILRKLEGNGIMDAHSMPDTGDGLQVSVGLFSDRGGADRRSRSVQRLGLKADIMEKKQTGTMYWVDLNPDGSKQPVPTENLIALEETGTRLEMKTCPRGA